MLVVYRVTNLICLHLQGSVPQIGHRDFNRCPAIRRLRQTGIVFCDRRLIHIQGSCVGIRQIAHGIHINPAIISHLQLSLHCPVIIDDLDPDIFKFDLRAFT